MNTKIGIRDFILYFFKTITMRQVRQNYENQDAFVLVLKKKLLLSTIIIHSIHPNSIPSILWIVFTLSFLHYCQEKIFVSHAMIRSDYILLQLAVDGAFGSYSEAFGGRPASLAYTPRRSLRKIFLLKKQSEDKNF